MQNITIKIQALFNQRMKDYENITADIIECLQFAVDGIKEYFLTVGVLVRIDDVMIVSGIFVFATVVENTLVETPQAFNVGVPTNVLLTQSNIKVCEFLTDEAAKSTAQHELNRTYTHSPVLKKRLH